MITHPTADRNEYTDNTTAKVDQGTTNTAGRIVLFDNISTELAVIPFSNPAFQSAVDGVATANQTFPDESTVAGEAVTFQVQDRDENEVWDGTVTDTGGGGDIELEDATLDGGGFLALPVVTYEGMP